MTRQDFQNLNILELQKKDWNFCLIQKWVQDHQDFLDNTDFYEAYIAAAEVCGITIDQILAKSNKRNVVAARQLCYIYMRSFLQFKPSIRKIKPKYTVEVIAKRMNLRDHSNIVHHLGLTNDLIDAGDPILKSLIINFYKVLNNGSKQAGIYAA